MATEADAIQGLEDFVNNMADSLGKSDPKANRLVSRTSSDGTSEQYTPISDSLLEIRRALEISETIEAKKNANGSMRFMKITRN